MRARQTIYPFYDLIDLQAIAAMPSTSNVSMRSIDELLERDRQREKDGFPRKINVGRLIKPGKGGKDKVVIVPTTVEEKFIHDPLVSKPRRKSEGGPADPAKAKKARSSANSRCGHRIGRDGDRTRTRGGRSA